ncbi:RlpA-like double-psi beta-barrel-protein domain-containing protein-containing protein [Suillus subluteus]|nr:RlpA-like double-psi beta-barrel-protein domain-containing protein-containing protein [Suillus subluteus]
MHSFHYLSVALCVLSSLLFSQVTGFSGVKSSAHDRSRRLAHVRALSGNHQPRALDLSVNQSRDTKISKRDTFTYFQDGSGACGAFNQPTDFIVALSTCDYDGGSHCFQMMTITVNGVSTQAQVTDECLGCPCGGLDFSQGLFEFFAPTSVGELSGSWSYVSASTSSTPLPSTTTKQSSTSTTSTWTPPTTTSSSTPTPTLTTTSTFAATTTSMPTTASTPLPTTTSSTASPLPTFSPDNPQILAQANLGLIELGSLLQACAALSSES